MNKFFILLFICFFKFMTIEAETIRRYVKPEETGSLNTKDGKSWETASDNLQEMIDAVAAEVISSGGEGEVWVAAGTYIPTLTLKEVFGDFRYPTDGTGDIHKSFFLKNGVKIYGGFAGIEDNLDDRDWIKNKTILSGDISGTNVYHVVVSAGIEKALLDGFFIEKGRAIKKENLIPTSNPQDLTFFSGHGGGMYIYKSSPTLTHLVIRDNETIQGGGGVFLYQSESTIVNSLLYGNTAFFKDPETIEGATGGGLYSSDSNIEIIHVTIAKNFADHYGAGIDVVKDKSTEIEFNIYNSIVYGNKRGETKFDIEEDENFFVNLGCNVEVDHCLIGSITQGHHVTINNTINDDPQFHADDESKLNQDSPCLNFRLKEGSKAIDKGHHDYINTDDYPYDLAKTSRNQGEGVDMGAFEGGSKTEETPTISFESDNTTICEGDDAAISLKLTGEAPWHFKYQVNDDPTEKESEKIEENSFIWIIKNLKSETKYTITQIKDNKNDWIKVSPEAKTTISVNPAANPGTIKGPSSLTLNNSYTYTIEGNELTGKWISSDPSIAEIDESSGILKAKAIGNAVITYEIWTEVECPYSTSLPIVIRALDPGPGPGPGPEPEPETPVLQWSVSTTTNTYSAFVDVDNDVTTTVTEGTPVYLQIRPIVDESISYNGWSITYTAVPDEYHYPASVINKNTRYTFNQGNAHLLKGEYIYTVERLTLYQNGYEVYSFRYRDPVIRHTIKIIEKNDPDPNPEPWINVGQVADWCPSENDLHIPFYSPYRHDSLEYIIRFPEEALAAGFENMETYTQLPELSYIILPVNNSISPGVYDGNIVVRPLDDESTADVFPFRFTVMETVNILEHPQSISKLREGDRLHLSVEATGRNLTYQWFHNGKKIPEATSKEYNANMTVEHEGIYYVEVYSDCGWSISEEATISSCFVVLLKWTDVMYVQNSENQYVNFQWYKNGQAITNHGTSIYYTDPEGLSGSYTVRAYKGDGTYDESCSLQFDTPAQASSISVYPTILKQNDFLNIESNEVGESYLGALIEMHNMNGQKVYAGQMNNTRLLVPANQPSGVYLLHITPRNGRRTVQKIIIK